MTIAKKIFNALFFIIFTVIILAGAFLLCSRLFGLRLYAVQTESMQESYPKGSLVVVREVKPENVSEGDVISFVVSTDAVVTHRVVRNDASEQLIYTKGDENDSEDSEPVAYENVLGRAVFSVPNVGYAVLFMDTVKGKVVLGIAAGLAALYLVISGGVRLYTWDMGSGRKLERSGEEKKKAYRKY